MVKNAIIFKSKFFIKIFLLILILFIGFSVNLRAQWINNPASNTKLITDLSDPINISLVKDINGGAYIFWEDRKSSQTNDVYFLHFDENGKVSFRTDGKTVSKRSGGKVEPLPVADQLGNAVVIWKNHDKKLLKMFAQKVNRNGLRLWTDDGLQIPFVKGKVVDYSIDTDTKGNSYIGFVAKNPNAANKYSVKYQIISSSGKFLCDSLKGIIYSSNSNVSDANIVNDNNGGAFIFWLENQNQKTILRALLVDSAGTKKWGGEPITISKSNSSVINYSVAKFGSNVYAVINYQGEKKNIFQQMISDKGKLLWGNDGKPVTNQKGNQINPQFVIADSSVIITWTNEYKNVKDVFVQRFNSNGTRLWETNGIRIINFSGNQFGQRIVYDNKANIIIAWIDRRDDNSFADLYIQKINLNGKIQWDSLGVLISSAQNTQKSYLNLISENDGGAVAVFKGKTNNKNDIYGQKIFSTGTYASQILGFSVMQENDSVKVIWYAANESQETYYNIERSTEKNDTDNLWEIIGTIIKGGDKRLNYYEFYDIPDINGSIYYRIAQHDKNIDPQFSQAHKVDVFKDVDKIILAQNSPNPFSDSTVINFYLPKEEKISVEFFNGTVEMVREIENQKFPAGKNEIVFYAEDLKPGIYFYRLKTNSFVDVRKMVITE
jgi:hypothetical protein